MTNRILTGGLLAVAVMLSAAPAALAEPVPNPDPVPVPAPNPGSIGGQGGCQGGEVMQYGNCVPNMTPVTTDEGYEGAAPEAPLRLSDEHTSTTQSGLPVDLVPNINGTPCTGYWMSGACYAERFNSGPAVIPKSTLSNSP